jgi:pimeloyl-ACP methyl ester carboxylesterase
MPTLSLNDIQLYYEVHGQGPPLVLIAGVGQGRNYWELADVLPTLTQDFRVISFDNRGIGQSSMPDMPYTVEMMAGDTLALLDQLKVERAHVIGHSLGAMIAFELGLNHPERVGGVVMLSGLYPGPSAVLPTPAATELLLNRQGDPGELARRGIVVATAPGFESKHPDLVEALVQIALNRTQPPVIFLRQLGASQAYLQTDKLIPPATFHQPLCLLHGEADQATSYPNGELIKAKIPQAHLHLIAEAGHMLPIEQPGVWIELVKVFFSETSTSI